MLCSMCPTVTVAPGKGWQCGQCHELNCRHILRCKCGQNRYEQERCERKRWLNNPETHWRPRTH